MKTKLIPTLTPLFALLCVLCGHLGAAEKKASDGATLKRRFELLDKNPDGKLTSDEITSERVRRYDKNGELKQPVIFDEAAFNELVEFRAAPDALPQWPIGFQIVYEAPGKKSTRRDPSSYILKNEAWFFLRDANANYTLQRIASDARLFLARDFKPSPFASESGVLYACGFNGSYWKGSLGTAWIYRGEFKK